MSVMSLWLPYWLWVSFALLISQWWLLEPGCWLLWFSQAKAACYPKGWEAAKSEHRTEPFKSLTSAHGVAWRWERQQRGSAPCGSIKECRRRKWVTDDFPGFTSPNRACRWSLNTRAQGLGFRVSSGTHTSLLGDQPSSECPPSPPVPHLLALQARPALPHYLGSGLIT